jgi:hypothetical protein
LPGLILTGHLAGLHELIGTIVLSGLIQSGSLLITTPTPIVRTYTTLRNILSHIGTTGLRLQVEFSNTDSNDFFITEIMLDYQLLGSADEYATVQTVKS